MKEQTSGFVKALSYPRKNFLIFVLLVQLMVILTTSLNIPVARQVIGFFFFSFVSGFVALRLFRISELDLLETVLFTVGFSVAILVLSSLLANEILPLFGFRTPLSVFPLLIIQCGFVTFGSVATYILDNGAHGSVSVSRSTSFRLFSASDLFLVILPILSVAGAMYSGLHSSNLLPTVLILLIASVFAVVVLRKRSLSPNVYPLSLIVIAISLLFQSSLISQNIVCFGADVPVEYFVAKTTQSSAYWNSNFPFPRDIGYGRLNAMLSISILPTAYANLLNLDLSLVFKVLFPLLFSFVPVCIYKFWAPTLDKKGAFIAAFVFLAMEAFYGEMLGLCRQMIAELFFCLLLIVVFSSKIKPFSKTICFSLFAVTLVVSHYALAEIFLFFLLGLSVPLIALKKPNRRISVSLIVIFCVIMFSWYIYTSRGSVFDSALEYGANVMRQLDEFFNPESRGTGVLLGLGLVVPSTFWNLLGRVFAYLTEAFIVLGFVGLVTKRMNMDMGNEKSLCCMSAVVLLGLTILIPGLASTLGITRFYHVLLFFLSGLFCIGISFFSRLFFDKRKTKEVIAVLLVMTIVLPYFFFQSGLVYELTGSQSYSLPLSRNRIGLQLLAYHFGYFSQNEVNGASWLSKNISPRNTIVISDYASRIPLQFNVYGGYIVSEYYSTVKIAQNYSVCIYLNRVNLFEEWGLGKDDYVWNYTMFASVLNSTSTIYSSGGCEVYGK